MKASDLFTQAISAHLKSVAAADPLFAVTFKKKNKNIKDCVTYIMNTVKASGCNGFADEEVYNMAVHYYDEDDIVIHAPIKGNVIVNHSVASPVTDKNNPKVEAKSAPIRTIKKQLIVENQSSLF